MALRFDVLTLFPSLFDGFVGESLLEKAIQAGLVEIHRWNIRDWTKDKHGRVDDRPYGGGPGMVIAPQPVFDCVEAVQAMAEPGLLLAMTPQGERLTQRLVAALAAQPRLLLLCGRYEGFDERIHQGLRPREISIGDFICNGGEVPAMVIIEAVMRLAPGVLGDAQSAAEDSFSQPEWLEYPQYTRPPEFRGLSVPSVLLGGNHKEIARWRAEQARRRSELRREAKGPMDVDQNTHAEGGGEQPQNGGSQAPI